MKRPAPGPNPPTTPSNKVIKHEPGPGQSPNTNRVQIPMRPNHPGPRPQPNGKPVFVFVDL